MEVEFINAYIAKQKSWIDELTSKWLLAESKISVTDKQIEDLRQQVVQLKQALEEASQKNNKKQPSL